MPQMQHLKIIQLRPKQTIMTATIICGESSAYLSLKSILQFTKSIWMNQCRTTIVLASKHLTTRLVSFVLLCVHLHQLLFIENDKSYQIGPKPAKFKADDELRSNLSTSRLLFNNKSILNIKMVLDSSSYLNLNMRDDRYLDLKFSTT